MKKVLLAVAVVMLAMSVNAQAQFGIKGGLNFANITEKEGSASISYDSKIGFHLGAIVDLGLSENLSIQPGVLFSQKGAKSGDNKMNFNYLDIPVNLMYKFDAGTMKIFLQAGPALSYCLSAKANDTDIKDELNSMDFGLGFGAGVQFSNVQVSLGYTLGLANIAKNVDGDASVKNKVVGISVAYLFGGK